MKKDETFEEWCNSVGGNAQIDMELSMARTHLSECWNHQQKKIDELVELVNFKENQIVTINHNTGIRIRNLETKLHKADSIWRAQEKKTQDLEAKLAKAVEFLELWQAYSDGFAYDDRGNHRSEKDIYEEVEQVLVELEKGEGE